MSEFYPHRHQRVLQQSLSERRDLWRPGQRLHVLLSERLQWRPLPDRYYQLPCLLCQFFYSFVFTTLFPQHLFVCLFVQLPFSNIHLFFPFQLSVYHPSNHPGIHLSFAYSLKYSNQNIIIYLQWNLWDFSLQTSTNVVCRDKTHKFCQNGGTCKDQVNGYTCHCPSGYNGDHCQTGKLTS